ncbi:MAG: hypothetical protein PHH85_01640 [Candidatus Methanoperedens sp.]|nr:hypothetical protein [Candidatus Methanoperedens sp.]
MNNKSGLVVIAAGIAAFLLIKGSRDSGSLFGSGGGDSGQPSGTILAGLGTSSSPSSPMNTSPAPSSLWDPSPTNYSPQPFQISDKIVADMAAAQQSTTSKVTSSQYAPTSALAAAGIKNVYQNNITGSIPVLAKLQPNTFQQMMSAVGNNGIVTQTAYVPTPKLQDAGIKNVILTTFQATKTASVFTPAPSTKSAPTGWTAVSGGYISKSGTFTRGFIK